MCESVREQRGSTERAGGPVSLGRLQSGQRFFFSQQTDTHDSLVEKVVESLNFNSSTKFNEKKIKICEFRRRKLTKLIQTFEASKVTKLPRVKDEFESRSRVFG